MRKETITYLATWKGEHHGQHLFIRIAMLWNCHGSAFRVTFSSESVRLCGKMKSTSLCRGLEEARAFLPLVPKKSSTPNALDTEPEYANLTTSYRYCN